jgi:hypothetical protein
MAATVKGPTSDNTETAKPVAPPVVVGKPAGLMAKSTLALPRRNTGVGRSTKVAQEFSEASAETRRQIRQVVEITRSPFEGGGTELYISKAHELERSLEQLEARLTERERVVTEMEFQAAERVRELAEGQALLKAHEQLIAASRNTLVSRPLVSREEQTALAQLKQALDQQEASLREAKEALREREAFLDESETRLFDKVQGHQEKETELEQREEEVRAKERLLRETAARTDPELAAQLAAEKTAKRFDEFNE